MSYDKVKESIATPSMHLVTGWGGVGWRERLSNIRGMKKIQAVIQKLLHSIPAQNAYFKSDGKPSKFKQMVLQMQASRF